jgi:F0F1-type ATP synthase membrane subunit b/b'
MDLYEPPTARAALAKASKLRQQYQAAVRVVQRDRQLSKPEKAQRLRMLHQAHQQAMGEKRRIRHQAHREAARQAVRDLALDEASPSALRLDLYQRALEEAMGKTVPELARSFDAAELIGNTITMRAVAVAALGKRTDLPNDPAEALVARFAQAHEPNGNGGWRHRFPRAAGGWERLAALEEWERGDHLAADALFSVAATPEKPEDPTPQDPIDQARADVAALYRQAPASAGGGGDGGQPRAVG